MIKNVFEVQLQFYSSNEFAIKDATKTIGKLKEKKKCYLYNIQSHPVKSDRIFCILMSLT